MTWQRGSGQPAAHLKGQWEGISSGATGSCPRSQAEEWLGGSEAPGTQGRLGEGGAGLGLSRPSFGPLGCWANREPLRFQQSLPLPRRNQTPGLCSQTTTSSSPAPGVLPLADPSPVAPHLATDTQRGRSSAVWAGAMQMEPCVPQSRKCDCWSFPGVCPDGICHPSLLTGLRSRR